MIPLLIGNTGSAGGAISVCAKRKGKRIHRLCRCRYYYAYNGDVCSSMDYCGSAETDVLSGDRADRPSDDCGGSFPDVSDHLAECETRKNTADYSIGCTDCCCTLYRVYGGGGRSPAYDGGLADDSDVRYHCIYRRIYLYLYSGIHERIS